MGFQVLGFLLMFVGQGLNQHFRILWPGSCPKYFNSTIIPNHAISRERLNDWLSFNITPNKQEL